MNSLVSIIIPTYNRAHDLKKCLQHCLKQTYQNIEILVCDDGSTDNTKEIVQSFSDTRIRYHLCQHYGFPSGPRNEGLSQAKGEWLAFCDSDDYWLEKKLQTQLDLLEIMRAKASCSNAYIDAQNHLYYQGHKRALKTLDLLKANQVICSSLIVHKDLLAQSGNFSQDKEFRAYEDYELWLRLSHFSPILYTNDALLYYTTTSPDSIRLNDFEKDDRKRLLVYKSFLSFCFSKHHWRDFFMAGFFVLKMKLKILWKHK